MPSLVQSSLGLLCILGNLSMADAALAQSFTLDGDDRVTMISNLPIGTGTFDVTFNPNQSFNDLFGSPLAPSPVPTFFTFPAMGSGIGTASAAQAAVAISDALNLAAASPSGMPNSGETAGASGDGFFVPSFNLGATFYQQDTNSAVGVENITEDGPLGGFDEFPIATFSVSTTPAIPEGSTVLGTLMGLILGGGLWVRHQKRRAV